MNRHKHFTKASPVSSLFRKPKIKKEPYKGSERHKKDLLKDYNEFAFN